MRSERPAFVSLFSGAGGLDCGLERAGWACMAAVERDDACVRTLEANRDAGHLGDQGTLIVHADVAQLDPHDLRRQVGLTPGGLDLLAGGPPCQAFSTAGRRGTLTDPRGMLIFDFARAVAALRPRFFVMENVRGLLSAAVRHRPLVDRPARGGPPLQPDEQPGSVVELWVAELGRLTGGEYRVDVFEVNAANYGAPQIRERVLFVGNRLGRLIDFPEPSHGPGRALPFATLGDALAAVSVDDGACVDFSDRKKRWLSMVPEGGNWRALPEDAQRESMGRAFHAKGGRSGWWRRLSRDLPCPTITTMPNHASTSLCHPTETRALTVRECAAVQEFPDGWRFEGTVAQRARMVGNAVPVRLGEVAGRVLLAEHRSERPPDPAAPAMQRVYLDSVVRTRRWYRDGQAVVRP